MKKIYSSSPSLGKKGRKNLLNFTKSPHAFNSPEKFFYYLKWHNFQTNMKRFFDIKYTVQHEEANFIVAKAHTDSILLFCETEQNCFYNFFSRSNATSFWKTNHRSKEKTNAKKIDTKFNRVQRWFLVKNNMKL